MSLLIVIFHYGQYQPLWQQPFVMQAGPNMSTSDTSLYIPILSIYHLSKELKNHFPGRKYLLIHYTDPFIIKYSPLLDLKEWKEPSILACGDLHHGQQPISTLASYLLREPHNRLILTFNPSLLEKVRSQVSIPVNSFPPGFFRYPVAVRNQSLQYSLVHIGNIGPYHFARRTIVEELLSRQRISFKHFTTESAESAATIYANHALAINIPLNSDLNHRFFEIMSAGVPQIVYGDKGIVGPSLDLANREDIFWASSIEEVEDITIRLFSDKESLNSIQVLPPPYSPIQQLIKSSFLSI